MAAKKVAEKKEEKITAAKKTVVKKTAEETKKAAEKKPAVKAEPKKAEVKKAEVKKAEPKKEAAKKPAAKKAAAKKPAAKKTAEKKPAVVKKSAQEYKDVINWKKWEAHNMNWTYIEINAGDLMTELEAGVNNIKTVDEAMRDTMLEGDHFIDYTEKADTKMTVRYYCDNLSPERRKWSEVN